MAWTVRVSLLKVWGAKRAARADGKDRPWRFWEAVLFQWVNPKLWAVALAASTGFSIGLPPLEEALRLSSAFSGINLFVCLFWSFAGSLLSLLLARPPAWRVFMRVMAVLLALSAVMVFL